MLIIQEDAFHLFEIELEVTCFSNVDFPYLSIVPQPFSCRSTYCSFIQVLYSRNSSWLRMWWNRKKASTVLDYHCQGWALISIPMISVSQLLRYRGEISLLNQNLDNGQILQILSSNATEQEVQIQPTMAWEAYMAGIQPGMHSFWSNLGFRKRLSCEGWNVCYSPFAKDSKMPPNMIIQLTTNIITLWLRILYSITRKKVISAADIWFVEKLWKAQPGFCWLSTSLLWHPGSGGVDIVTPTLCLKNSEMEIFK